MSTTYPTKTYQEPQIDPQAALNQVNTLEAQFETELSQFKAMASGSDNGGHPDPGMALMYFMMVVFGTFLDYQGSEMNMYSAQMDVLSILNTDLSNMQSDFNNIIGELQGQVSSGGTASLSSTDSYLESFINDSAQYAVDIGHWFGGGDVFGGPNGDVSSFLNNIRAEVNTFYSDPSGGDQNFFYEAQNDPTDLADDLAPEFQDAFQSSISAGSGTEDGSSGYGSELKSYQDVFTEMSSSQNQTNSTSQTNLSSDQQQFNSYQGTMKNLIQMFINFYKSVTQAMQANG